MSEIFRKLSNKASAIVGSPWSFLIAVAIVIAWALSGPLFGFSDTWQLVINTGTTIITFLMVFLIQNTQNRDAKAIHLKLDELIFANKKARNKMLNLEESSEEELEQLHNDFLALNEHSKDHLDTILQERERRKKTQKPKKKAS